MQFEAERVGPSPMPLEVLHQPPDRLGVREVRAKVVRQFLGYLLELLRVRAPECDLRSHEYSGRSMFFPCTP